MYTGQAIKRMMYGDRIIRPKSPKVKTLPIAYNITEAHTDFPIYIKPSSITGFGSLTLAEAQSLRFYADAGKTTELPREIVSADEIYVKNTLATGTGNKLYLDWDGVSSDYAVSDTYGARNVWNSNYKAVYHFEGNANDSTSNGNNGTGYNMTYSGGAGVFNGSSSYIKILDNSGLRLPTLTWQIKTKYTGSGTHERVLFRKDMPSPRTLYGFTYINGIVSEMHISGKHYSSSTHQIGTTISNYHMTISGSGGILKFYVNGSKFGSDVPLGTFSVPNTDITIGTPPYSTKNYYQGEVYEARILKNVLTSSRISTEHANQSNPATFFGTLS